METAEINSKNDVATENTDTSRNNKRFNLKLSQEAYVDIDQLSRLGGGRSMSEVVRLALSLLKAVYPAIAGGSELYLVDPKANTERQIILPR